MAPSYSKYDTRRRSPNPSAAVLLVIDMQNYFSAMAAPILPSLNSTIALCRRRNIPVIFTRHRHTSSSDGPSTLSEWWSGDLIMDGTPESVLLPSLDRNPSDPIVEKNTYSAFRGTGLEEMGLEEMLTDLGAEEVIVTGVMTNLCCETTAREAFVRGFRVFFSTDATATANTELHEAAIANLAYGFAYLVDCERLEKGLGLGGTASG